MLEVLDIHVIFGQIDAVHTELFQLERTSLELSLHGKAAVLSRKILDSKLRVRLSEVEHRESVIRLRPMRSHTPLVVVSEHDILLRFF